MRYSDDSFTSSFITTIGIDFKIKSILINASKVKLQIWDTAGQERFRTITTAYYRGAMGILLVYDVTDEASFSNVRNWMRQIDQNAAENVNRVLIGNKCDMDEQRVSTPMISHRQSNERHTTLTFHSLFHLLQKVSFESGKALASEFNIKFFETSAKLNTNVDKAFQSIASEIVERLQENPEHYGSEGGVQLDKNRGNKTSAKSCC